MSDGETIIPKPVKIDNISIEFKAEHTKAPPNKVQVIGKVRPKKIGEHPLIVRLEGIQVVQAETIYDFEAVIFLGKCPYCGEDLDNEVLEFLPLSLTSNDNVELNVFEHICEHDGGSFVEATVFDTVGKCLVLELAEKPTIRTIQLRGINRISTIGKSMTSKAKFAKPIELRKNDKVELNYKILITD